MGRTHRASVYNFDSEGSAIGAASHRVCGGELMGLPEDWLSSRESRSQAIRDAQDDWTERVCGWAICKRTFDVFSWVWLGGLVAGCAQTERFKGWDDGANSSFHSAFPN